VTEIVLVRHAATAWTGLRYCGRSDPPLSERGAGDAGRLATSLGPTLDADWLVVTSPSRRAVTTAEAIAEGRTFDELAADHPDLAASLAAGDLAIDWPDGETHQSLDLRVTGAWDALLERGRSAVVVTHAGPLLHAHAIAMRRAISPEGLIAPAAFVRVSVGADGRVGAPVLPSRA
jgi:broad specificity phosphatase PhoE